MIDVIFGYFLWVFCVCVQLLRCRLEIVINFGPISIVRRLYRSISLFSLFSLSNTCMRSWLFASAHVLFSDLVFRCSNFVVCQNVLPLNYDRAHDALLAQTRNNNTESGIAERRRNSCTFRIFRARYARFIKENICDLIVGSAPRRKSSVKSMSLLIGDLLIWFGENDSNRLICHVCKNELMHLLKWSIITIYKYI